MNNYLENSVLITRQAAAAHNLLLSSYLKLKQIVRKAEEIAQI